MGRTTRNYRDLRCRWSRSCRRNATNRPGLRYRFRRNRKPPNRHHNPGSSTPPPVQESLRNGVPRCLLRRIQCHNSRRCRTSRQGRFRHRTSRRIRCGRCIRGCFRTLKAGPQGKADAPAPVARRTDEFVHCPTSAISRVSRPQAGREGTRYRLADQGRKLIVTLPCPASAPDELSGLEPLL
jgi:hypothetical protein